MTIIAALAPAVVSLVAIAALMWWSEPMDCERCAEHNTLCEECLRDIQDDTLGG